MKASDFVARYLETRGVTHVFELVGGMITHLLDSISRQGEIQIVSCHHEQAAGFAAEGYARILGVPGVALATSGPGATNLLTAIGSCYFDSIPTVFITGQVNTYELKGDRAIRQLGFQETDIVSMAAPICKSAVQVQCGSDLPRLLHEAFEIALDGRQGPCLIDLPMNVQAEMIDEELAEDSLSLASQMFMQREKVISNASDHADLSVMLKQLSIAIADSKRPMLLLGGGCASPANRLYVADLCAVLGIPVVLSLMGVDLLPADHPLRVGFIGSYGNRWANQALGEADLLVVIGSRLDIRQTGSDVQSFCEGKRIWQVDLDPGEFDVRLQSDQKICCSVQRLACALAGWQIPSLPQHDHWHRRIAELKAVYPARAEYLAGSGEINPIVVLQDLSQRMQCPCQYVTDVGQHQMWAAQSLQFQHGDRMLTSGGMGAMGFGLPTAIGACFARPEMTTVLISGDGSFQLNIQELETVKRNNLNLKMVIFNNQCHGMVRQFQESYFDGNLQSTADGYSAPDFVAVAAAYGISSKALTRVDLLVSVLDQWLASSGPALLEVAISTSSKVYPKLAFGRRFGEMEPEAQPIAMEST